MGKSELLIYVVILVAVVAFNYVMQMLAKRARAMQERQQAQDPQQEPARQYPGDDDELDVAWGRSEQATLPAAVTQPAEAQSAQSARHVDAVVPARARAPRRTATSALLRSRQDLRHAIIVMTVLGPCRALEPYDPSPGKM